MDRKRANIIGVGLTLTAGLFLLGYYSTYLAWEDLRPWRTYRVTFARTIGLAKEDPVFVCGYKIGRVHQISFEGDHQLVELQLDPSVRLHQEDVSVFIESTNAFGSVGVFVEPGRTQSSYWDPERPLPGTFRESLAASSDTQQTSGLSETLKDFEAFTETLTKIDASRVGRLVNDPDPGIALRDGFEQVRATTRNFADAAAVTSAGDGLGAVIVRDTAVTFDLAIAGTRDNVQNAREALATANRGEGGLIGRLGGDQDAARSVRDGLTQGAGLFRGYEHSEGGGITGALTHNDDAADRIGGYLDDMADKTERARRGEGSLGGLFGPDSGANARESIASFAQKLEAMTAADASAGAFFARSPDGRRAAEDFASRVDDVLRDMRRALSRIRADQAPNTFPGALLSVF